MSDWNPESYLTFERERTQPARDLAARIELESPARVLDLGCGPGNSTAVLQARWPTAQVIGLDNSPAMLEQASQTLTGIEWIEADAGADLSSLGPFDLVFANASLQWIPDHPNLIPRLFALLNPGGALAFQVPRFNAMPVHHAIVDVTTLPEYAGYFAEFESGMHYFEDRLYYDLLTAQSRALSLWATDYYHVLNGHSAVLDWVQSTGMRPYLERLPEDRRQTFKAEVLLRIENEYPAQADGNLLFIFKRLFAIAYRT